MHAVARILQAQNETRLAETGSSLLRDLTSRWLTDNIESSRPLCAERQPSLNYLRNEIFLHCWRVGWGDAASCNITAIERERERWGEWESEWVREALGSNAGDWMHCKQDEWCSRIEMESGKRTKLGLDVIERAHVMDYRRAAAQDGVRAERSNQLTSHCNVNTEVSMTL